MSDAPESSSDPSPGAVSRLGEVAIYFTQLGFTAFGGPAAHIALMERQLVERRRWLDRQHFLDLLSAINLIPGPNSTQLAISLGYLRAGPLGLLAAGVCFILPAVIIILPIAWLYVLYGQTPHAAGALRGVSAAVLAIVATATIKLARASVKDHFSILIAIGAAAAAFVGHHLNWPATDLLILAIAAIIGIARSSPGWRMPVALIGLMPVAVVAVPGGLWLMSLLFLKIGATLYGSGYLLLPYLRANFVTGHAWLTERQLLDAVAVGQVTPGPLLTTATFIGFVLGYDSRFGGSLGTAIGGALLATGAIFGPSFVFIALLGKVLPKVRKHPAARGALDAMNAAVVSLIGVTLVMLAGGVLHPAGSDIAGAVLPGGIIAATMFVLWRWDINATWPIAIAALIGWAA